MVLMVPGTSTESGPVAIALKVALPSKLPPLVMTTPPLRIPG